MTVLEQLMKIFYKKLLCKRLFILAMNQVGIQDVDDKEGRDCPGIADMKFHKNIFVWLFLLWQ